MSPLNEEQLEQIRHERRLQIMTAALRIFAENGIKLTKISMIATEAGVSHGLLYHYFSSKEEILHESLTWAMSDTKALFEELNQQPLIGIEKIRHFTKFALSKGSSDIFRIIDHLSRSDAPVLEATKTLIENTGNLYIEHILQWFIAGQEAGHIIESAPEELTYLYLTLLSGILRDDPTWWNENCDQKIALLLRMFTVH